MLLHGYNDVFLGNSTITVNGTSVGATYDITTNDQVNFYLVRGTPTLSSSLSFTNSAPLVGQVFMFYFDAPVTLGVNALTFFGRSIPSNLALTPFIAMAWYQAGGFHTVIAPSGDASNIIRTGQLENLAVTDGKIASVSGTKIIPSTIPTGAYAALSIVAADIANATITGAKIAPNTIANANMAQMAAMTIKSNLTGTTANAADNTINAFKNYIGGSGWMLDTTPTVLTASPGSISFTNSSTFYNILDRRNVAPGGIIRVRFYGDGITTTGTPTQLRFASNTFAGLVDPSTLGIGNGPYNPNVLVGNGVFYDGTNPPEPIFVRYTYTDSVHRIDRFDGSPFPATIDFICLEFEIPYTIN